MSDTETGAAQQHTAPYAAHKAAPKESAQELRERIPGWGADLDPADRPAHPKEQPGIATGAHWDFPDRQQQNVPREMSIEHGMLPPVFGTTAPLHGISGAIRKYAYSYGEGRAAHWLLLMAADRVDAGVHHVRSLATLRPDNPVTETGVLGEIRLGRHRRQGRVDVHHSWLDPLLVAGPWVLAGLAALAALRALRRGL